MRTPRRYLIFDLDGTLIDSMPEITTSLNYALRICGLSEVPHGRDLSWFVGPPLRDGFKKLLKTSDHSLTERLVTAYRDKYREVSLNSKLYPGIRSLLVTLYESKTLALATTKPTLYATKILERLELNRLFDLVVGCELDGTLSSKEELIRHVIRAYGGRPSDYLDIGDRRDDIVGAKKNNIDSVAVLYGYGTEAEIEEVGPTFTARSVKDLGSILTTSV